MANRNYDSHPPTDSSPSHTVQRDARGRVIPTLDTQELYNNWRDAEQQLEFENELRLRDGQGNLDANDLLPRPRSPSAASTSCTSAVSITHGLGNVGLSDNPVSENGTSRRKAKRHGPLGRDTKARAALVRKLGSCPSCKSRKVKCNHNDLSLFKGPYEASRNRRQPAIQPRPQLTVPTYTHGPPQQMSPTAVPGSANESDLLRGVGGDIAARFPGPSAGGGDDLDDILRLSPGGVSPVQTRTSPASPFVHFNSLMPMPRPTNPGLQVRMPSPPQLSFEDPPVAIGRQQIETAAGGWECQGYCSSSSQTSLSSIASETCLQCFSTLADLHSHYQLNHTSFRNPTFFYRCLYCKFINNIPEDCPECENRPRQLEIWYYGYVGSLSNSSLPYTPLFVGQDKPASMPYSGDPGFSGGFNSNYKTGGSSYQSGWFANGNGNGSGSDSAGNNQYCLDQHTKKDDYGPMACNDVVVETLYIVCHLQDTLPDPGPIFQRRLPGLSISAVVICMLPFLLVCIILYTAVLQGCSTSDCIGVAFGRWAARVLQAIRAHISAIAFICVFVGLLVMWLFKHIKFRIRRGRSLSGSAAFATFFGLASTMASTIMPADEKPTSSSVVKHSAYCRYDSV